MPHMQVSVMIIHEATLPDKSMCVGMQEIILFRECLQQPYSIQETQGNGIANATRGR